MVFVAVIILVFLSIVGAVELSERSYDFEKIMERNRKFGKVVPQSMKVCKRKLDGGTVFLWIVCAGVLLIYAAALG